MQIYVTRDGERSGPYSLEEVNRQLAAGRLSPMDQGWSEGSPGWKPLLSFPGVIMPGGASSTAMPFSIATPMAARSTRFAGFWIRVVAYLIDCIILTIPIGVAQFMLRPSPEDSTMAVISALVIHLVYFAAFWSSSMQASVGQRICGLKVVNAVTRERISFLRALKRSFALLFAIMILFIGVIMVAFTVGKRGLHDMIADTYVVKRT